MRCADRRPLALVCKHWDLGRSLQVPKVTLTVFSTGKVMITGAKNREMLYDAFEKLYPDIEACKR